MSNIKYACLDSMLCKLSHVNVIIRRQGMIISEMHYTQFHMAWCLYTWGNVTVWGFKFFGFLRNVDW